MERGPTLPGVEEDDEDRIVLHVDLDCFYAACERLREPELEGEPVVVGMGYEPGEPEGAVATASYEAREYGVESAQAISTALERLPRAATADDTGATDADEPVGHYRPVDMAYYESIAAEVKAILHDAADTVREVSIDEAYLDVTDRTDWSVAEGYGRHVKQRIEREVGLTASVGVAPTMHAAKVASDHDKPDGLVVVEPGEVADFLAPLPVDDLHGIGPVTARELREDGVETVADLADADRDRLRDRYGERGMELHDRARGIDPRVVEPRGRPKSLSRESAFAEPQDDAEQVRERIRALADAVADRARSKDAMYRTIGIKVVLPPYDVNTRERSLPGPVDDPELVTSVALDLHDEFADERPRKVGVRVSNLQFGAADQSTLGGWDGADGSAGDATDPATDGDAEPAGDGEIEPTGDGEATAAGDGDAEPTVAAAPDSAATDEPTSGSAAPVEPVESDGAGPTAVADAGEGVRALTAFVGEDGDADSDADDTDATGDADCADAEGHVDDVAADDSAAGERDDALPPAAADLPPGQTTLLEFT